jgi:hypothetical protein
MASKSARTFYVLLTKTSDEPQPVWESWNSWGYYAVSFELTGPNGQRVILKKKPAAFTRNYPSTNSVPPHEQQVFPIHPDNWWEAKPPLPRADEIQITLEAIYAVLGGVSRGM